MPRPFRIGILGLSHDHVWGNLRDLKEAGEAQLVAVADPNPPLRDRIKQEFGCTTHDSYDRLLETETLDAVYVYGDNRTSAELGAKAARRGLHVLIEKPMAADLRGADDLLAAARQKGVRLMVNWPFAWWPQLQHAIHLAKSGDIGQLWQVKYRAAHNGPRELGCSPYFCDWLYDPARNGGGALIDYCCYGAVLARSLLGMPARVSGVAGRFCKEDITVEDNGVLVMSYPRGLAISEGSWSQVGSPTAYVTVIHGSRGTLLVEPRAGGRLLRADDQHPAGVEVPVPLLPPERRNATRHFLHGIETGADFFELCQDRTGRDAQEILEAGLLSAAWGKEVSLPLRIDRRRDK